MIYIIVKLSNLIYGLCNSSSTDFLSTAMPLFTYLHIGHLFLLCVSRKQGQGFDEKGFVRDSSIEFTGESDKRSPLNVKLVDSSLIEELFLIC